MSNVQFDELLPGGNALVKEESVISSQKMPTSIATFYIKAHIVATNKRFLAHFPNVVLGLLPLWFENVNLPIKQISTVTIQVKYYLLRLIIGALLMMWSLGSISKDPGMVLLLLIGIVLFGSGMSPHIFVRGTGGETVSIPVVFWKKSEAQKFVQELNRTIAEQ